MIEKTPPLHPLFGTYVRMARARTHRETLVVLMQELANAHAGVFTVEVIVGPTTFEPMLREVPDAEVPLDQLAKISAIFGEMVNSLRSSLDYLVYALACGGNGWSDVPNTQFPIIDNLEDWPKVAGYRLNKVPPVAVARIRQLQPFEGCTWSATLRDFSNPDKHRLLSAMKSRCKVTIAGVPQGDRIPVRVAVEVYLNTGEPLIETLDALYSAVARVVAEFKPGFEGFPEIPEI